LSCQFVGGGEIAVFRICKWLVENGGLDVYLLWAFLTRKRANELLKRVSASLKPIPVLVPTFQVGTKYFGALPMTVFELAKHLQEMTPDLMLSIGASGNRRGQAPTLPTNQTKL